MAIIALITLNVDQVFFEGWSSSSFLQPLLEMFVTFLQVHIHVDNGNQKKKQRTDLWNSSSSKRQGTGLFLGRFMQKLHWKLLKCSFLIQIEESKCSSIVDKMSWRQAFHFYNYFWRGGVMCHLNIRISCTIGVLCTAGVLLGQWFWWKIISIMELFYWCRENLQSSQEWGTLLQPSGCYWGSWQVLFSYQLDFSVQLCWLNTELVLNKAVTAFGKKGVQLQLWWQKCLSEVV